MICSSTCLLRLTVWSSSKGQPLSHSGSIRRGNVRPHRHPHARTGGVPLLRWWGVARDRRCCPYSDTQGSGLLQRELTVVPHIARRKSCFDHFELKPILASSVTGGGQMRPRDFIKVVAGSKPAMFEGPQGGNPRRRAKTIDYRPGGRSASSTLRSAARLAERHRSLASFVWTLEFCKRRRDY
jgi:hypothetical protein